MSSGEYRLYLERHDPAHDTWPAPPPPASDSLPNLPAAVEDHDDPGTHRETDPAGRR